MPDDALANYLQPSAGRLAVGAGTGEAQGIIGLCTNHSAWYPGEYGGLENCR